MKLFKKTMFEIYEYSKLFFNVPKCTILQHDLLVQITLLTYVNYENGKTIS